MDVAAVVLAWTAASLVVEDTPVVDFVRARMTLPDQWQLYLHFIFIALVLLADLFIRLVIVPRRRAKHAGQAEASADTASMGETVDNKTVG